MSYFCVKIYLQHNVSMLYAKIISHSLGNCKCAYWTNYHRISNKLTGDIDLPLWCSEPSRNLNSWKFRSPKTRNRKAANQNVEICLVASTRKISSTQDGSVINVNRSQPRGYLLRAEIRECKATYRWCTSCC